MLVPHSVFRGIFRLLYFFVNNIQKETLRIVENAVFHENALTRGRANYIIKTQEK